MIDRKALLNDLTKLVGRLEEDLREQAKNGAAHASLEAEWQAAKRAHRTGDAFEMWVTDRITQAAVAWVLSCVFVRFLEDNELLGRPYLSGPGPRRQLALDHEGVYFRVHPTLNRREYLLDSFREIARLPAMDALLGEGRNPLWRVQLSADGASALVDFWRTIDPATGDLVHGFADDSWATRFLGDLYQDLSEYARKRYALLQTPDFVVTFILDQTLEHAIREFGYREVRLIDPTCGSGHFLLDAFHRLVRLWMRSEPGTNPRELAQRALDQVFGVDLSPTVIEIARFRLLVEALRVSGVRRLDQAPDFRANLAVGDSLLHGPRPRYTDGRQLLAWREEDRLAHVYDVEDADELKRILGQPYHVVVGNPPYVTPKDPSLRQAYRDRYESCSGKYSLGVPFTERFFDLAIAPAHGETSPAGYVGMITANSFMKREFGKKLIERFLSTRDLTHVIDTSRAHIPGHGTPTVVFLARNRAPVSTTVRAIRGIRSQATLPENPAQGLVWTAILDQIDRPGSVSEFVSSDDVDRRSFGVHPWSIGGGGAAELKERLDEASAATLGRFVESIGFASFTGLDEAFVAPATVWRRRGVPPKLARAFVYGECVRDYTTATELCALAPYGTSLNAVPWDPNASWARWLWPLRSSLEGVVTFGNKTRKESGDLWWTWYRWVPEKYRTPLSIVFAFVATHNHFVLDRGGKVFKQSAPVIKLPPGATDDDHLGLLGLLNSSTACFWLKETCHNKGGGGIGGGIASELWEQFYEFTGTKLMEFPLVDPPKRGRLEPIVKTAAELGANVPTNLYGALVPSRVVSDAARRSTEQALDKVIAFQEDLDWECYRLYGLVDETLALPPDRTPGIRLGERAFEIVMARKMAAGELETRWFERHSSTPVTETPAHWPEEYREIVRRRIEAIETDPDIALIEQPEYKRRWNTEPWEEQEQRALRNWLLERLEHARYWPAPPQLQSCATLADRLRHDAEFLQVAGLCRGRPDFDLTELVVELVEAEAVPFLAAYRYTESGKVKRTLWEKTWDLQRREDAGEKVEIDVPPKYKQGDFRSAVYWRLRGKLDVPKERFILYPLAGRDSDATPVVGWAGWDHLQQAKALASWIVERQQQDGWGKDRLLPLLAGVLELVPWLRQWHNDLDPESALHLGDYFAQWVEGEARKIGATLDDLRSYAPPAGTARRRRSRRARS